MTVDYVKIGSIIPYENNAKIHTDEQIEQIMRSIRDYGMNDPIGICGNTIVEGHGRYEACRRLGLRTVPVIHLDHLSDEERRAYTLVHNKTTMNSGYDANVLDSEIASLDFDYEFYGFPSFEINSDDFGTEFSLPDGDKNPACTMSFTLSVEQADMIEGVLDICRNEISETFGNDNAEGNALYEMCRQWEVMNREQGKGN